MSGAGWRFRLTICSVELLAGLLTGLLAGLTPLATDASERPNIVLILADDLGVEALGCYGGTSYRTPHLDRLAAEGVRFTRAYSQPLCTPTRVQLMTGRYNHRNWRAFGILDPTARTFGHMLQEAGYETAIFGKWQLQSYDPPELPGATSRRGIGMLPQDAGFDVFALFHALHTEDKGSRYANPTMLEGIAGEAGHLKTYPGAYGPDLWADKVLAFLRRDTDRPKFVYYPMALPHWPFEPTPQSAAWNPSSVPEADVQYAQDMLEKTDTIVGRIVEGITQQGQANDTVIIFYGDNGTDGRVFSRLQDGRLIQGGKATTRQTGIHVPLIVAGPGRFLPKSVESIVDASDFVPTLMDLARAELSAADRGDGVSFAKLLENAPTTSATELETQTPAGSLEHVESPSAPAVRDTAFFWYDPRPGWDKERFHRSVFAVNDRYKVFRDGRLVRLGEKPLAESVVHLNERTEEDRQAVDTLSRWIEARLAEAPEPPHVDAYGQPEPDLVMLEQNSQQARQIPQQLLSRGQEIVYGDPAIAEHRLWIFNPLDTAQDELRPGIVFIHGGSWGGTPAALAAQCVYLQQRGWNTVSIHFRAPKGKLTPADTLRDARQAYRWIMEHGHEHHIDTSRLVVSGGSAGGHLALALATIPLPDDPVIDTMPRAMVLFNPVIDLVDGWQGGRQRVVAAGMEPLAFSPAHHVRPGLPEMLILSGSDDTLITPAQLMQFQARMRAARNPCRVRIYPGATHAFFNYGRHENLYFYDTMRQFEEMLLELF